MSAVHAKEYADDACIDHERMLAIRDFIIRVYPHKVLSRPELWPDTLRCLKYEQLEDHPFSLSWRVAGGTSDGRLIVVSTTIPRSRCEDANIKIHRSSCNHASDTSLGCFFLFFLVHSA